MKVNDRENKTDYVPFPRRTPKMIKLDKEWLNTRELIFGKPEDYVRNTC